MIEFTPAQKKYLVRLKRSLKAKELAKTDNVSVGDFSGLKCSFRDEGETEEINSFMECDARD